MWEKIVSQKFFSGRALTGVLIGLVVWVLLTILVGSNLITITMVMLVAITIAQVSEPEHTAITSGMIGMFIGLYIGAVNYYQSNRIETPFDIVGIAIMGLLNAAILGLFWAMIGFLIGKIIERLKHVKNS